MVFIDETWAKTNMTRTHGWSDRGVPLIDKVPHGHWKTLTFIAGLRHDGIVAPCVIDGPINGESFAAWVEQFLIPDLAPGSIVVVDNLGSHKGVRVRRLLKAAGIKLGTSIYRSEFPAKAWWRCAGLSASAGRPNFLGILPCQPRYEGRL